MGQVEKQLDGYRISCLLLRCTYVLVLYLEAEES